MAKVARRRGSGDSVIGESVGGSGSLSAKAGAGGGTAAGCRADLVAALPDEARKVYLAAILEAARAVKLGAVEPAALTVDAVGDLLPADAREEWPRHREAIGDVVAWFVAELGEGGGE